MSEGFVYMFFFSYVLLDGGGQHSWTPRRNTAKRRPTAGKLKELNYDISFFLGSSYRGGRVMGMLIEKLEGGRRAGIENISACEAVVRRLHTLGIVHGDVNRHFFIVDKQSGTVRLIYFEAAQDYTDVKAKEEIDSLKDELVEDTGRGARMRSLL